MQELHTKGSDENQTAVKLCEALLNEVTVKFGRQARCETFNGVELLNLEHLAETCDSCTDVYMRFGLEGGKCIILERKQVKICCSSCTLSHALLAAVCFGAQ